MPKKKRKSPEKISDAKAQLIARVLVKGELTIKQIAADFGVQYQAVWRIFRERVNVSKVLSLRYPDSPEEK